MVKVYMFSQESIQEDLYFNGIGEMETETITLHLIEELEILSVLSIGGAYIISRDLAEFISAKYHINCYERLII